MSNYTNDAWHLDRDNIRQLMEWLADECGYTESKDIIQVIEKPWKWKREWALCELYYKHSHSSDVHSRDITERCIEAVADGTDAATVALGFGVTL